MYICVSFHVGLECENSGPIHVVYSQSLAHSGCSVNRLINLVAASVVPAAGSEPRAGDGATVPPAESFRSSGGDHYINVSRVRETVLGCGERVMGHVAWVGQGGQRVIGKFET